MVFRTDQQIQEILISYASQKACIHGETAGNLVARYGGVAESSAGGRAEAGAGDCQHGLSQRCPISGSDAVPAGRGAGEQRDCCGWRTDTQ